MPYEVVRKFEKTIAEFAGAKYGVAVESGSAGLFLSCLYSQVQEVTIPKRTYPSVPCSIINAGGWCVFSDEAWQGVYELKPYRIIDGALRFMAGMYEGGLHVVSFHAGKHLPIGRGGMILTDDYEAVEWLKRARFDGRAEKPLNEDDFTMLGWNMYMTPEQAARGLQLFGLLKNRTPEDLPACKQNYPDLSRYPIYATRRD